MIELDKACHEYKTCFSIELCGVEKQYISWFPVSCRSISSALLESMHVTWNAVFCPAQNVILQACNTFSVSAVLIVPGPSDAVYVFSCHTSWWIHVRHASTRIAVGKKKHEGGKIQWSTLTAGIISSSEMCTVLLCRHSETVKCTPSVP